MVAQANLLQVTNHVHDVVSLLTATIKASIKSHKYPTLIMYIMSLKKLGRHSAPHIGVT